jgi:septum formation protein
MLLPYSARLRATNVRIVLASTSPRRRELMALLFPPEPVASAPVSAAAAAGTSAASAAPVALSSASLSVPFRCVPSTFAEDLLHSDHASAASYACATSLAKAHEVWSRVRGEAHILLAADTVVVRDGVILEKPSSPEHAFDMLRSLVGRTHQVVTGCTMLCHADSAVVLQQQSSNSVAAVAASSSSSSSTAAAVGASGSSVLDAPLEVNFSVESSVTFAPASVLSDAVLRAYIASGEPFDKAGGYGYQSLAATFVTRIEGDYWNVVGFPLHELAVQIQPYLDCILGGLENERKEVSK